MDPVPSVSSLQQMPSRKSHPIRGRRSPFEFLSISMPRCKCPCCHTLTILVIIFESRDQGRLLLPRSVVKDHPEHKAKHITFTPNYRGDGTQYLASYEITLDGAGFLRSSQKLKKGESGSNVWYAYLDTNGPSPWFNDQVGFLLGAFCAGF